MSDNHNGQAQGHREPARRLRIDDLAAIVLRNSPGPTGATTRELLEGGHSGRRFVLVAGMTVLLIWGTLYLFFRDWRAKYRERRPLWDDPGCAGDRAATTAFAAQGRSGRVA